MKFLKSLIRQLGGNENSKDGLEYTALGVIVFLILVGVGKFAVYILSQRSFDLWNLIR